MSLLIFSFLSCLYFFFFSSSWLLCSMLDTTPASCDSSGSIGFTTDWMAESNWGPILKWLTRILFSRKKSSRFSIPVLGSVLLRYTFSLLFVSAYVRCPWSFSYGSCFSRFNIYWSVASITNILLGMAVGFITLGLSVFSYWPYTGGGNIIKILLAFSKVRGNPSNTYPRFKQSFWLSLH